MRCKVQVSWPLLQIMQPKKAATPARTPGLADLRAFITAAELRSFAAAAKALHLSLPAFSRRISNLETQHGAHAARKPFPA